MAGDVYDRDLGLGLDDLGHGEPALLLLTGWCSSRARWAPTAPLLAKNRRVVSFEWRGHGDSAPAAEDFGIEEMVQDALAVLAATEVQTFIPCSASHSGWVAIELRRRLAERVPGIVHLDWMLIEPSAAYMQLLAELQSGDRSPQRARAISVMNEQDAQMWMRSGREIERSYRHNGCPLRALAALEPPPEVLHGYGQPPASEYLAAQQEFAREHDWFSVHRIKAATHFSMIERPAEVAAAIEELTARVARR
jgi:pimeloyl-ACP methyl ester carboxylesterase